jgi:hypothetical protein
MIESNLITTDINNREPELLILYPDNETDWADILSDAWEEVTQDIRDNGWNIRRLCKRYSLQSPVTKTAAFTGTITTDEDYIQRLRLVINVAAKTGTGSITFHLEGTDDEGTTWETVNSAISVTTLANTTVVFTRVYKNYRLSITAFNTITSITYSAYLVETTFERLHLYKTMELIYRLQNRLSNDVYSDKEKRYADMYLDRLNSTQFAYDEDDDEEISEDEAEDNNQNVSFGV